VLFKFFKTFKKLVKPLVGYWKTFSLFQHKIDNFIGKMFIGETHFECAKVRGQLETRKMIQIQ